MRRSRLFGLLIAGWWLVVGTGCRATLGPLTRLLSTPTPTPTPTFTPTPTPTSTPTPTPTPSPTPTPTPTLTPTPHPITQVTLHLNDLPPGFQQGDVLTLDTQTFAELQGPSVEFEFFNEDTGEYIQGASAWIDSPMEMAVVRSIIEDEQWTQSLLATLKAALFANEEIQERDTTVRPSEVGDTGAHITLNIVISSLDLPATFDVFLFTRGNIMVQLVHFAPDWESVGLPVPTMSAADLAHLLDLRAQKAQGLLSDE